MKEENLTPALLAILILLSLTCAAYAILSNPVRIASTGTIKVVNVEAYWNRNCTGPVTSIDWGMIEPGASKNVTIYMKNEGNSPIVLSLNTSNWNPIEAGNHMSLSWNYSGAGLQPDQFLPVTLTLTAARNITGITAFNFDITIIGAG